MHEEQIFPLMYDWQRFNIPSHSTHGHSIGMWGGEIKELMWSCLNSPEGNWIEVGSHKGGSSVVLCICRNFLKLGPKIFTIDPEYTEFFDQNITRGNFWNIIRKINGTSKTFKESYPDEKISFLFIDGWHSFKWVIQDFNNIVDNLTDKATIVFHDCSPSIYSKNNSSYIESCIKSAIDNYEKWIKDENQNFLVDEAICWLMNKYKLEQIDIPVRTNETHFKETGLKSYKHGTTSPYSSVFSVKYSK
jgi:hypothetical protein